MINQKNIFMKVLSIGAVGERRREQLDTKPKDRQWQRL
jgi:hypothetical protein